METDSEAARGRRTGWILPGFGVADLVRLPPEILVVREGGAYLALLLLDLVIGLLAFAAGLGQIRNRPWGWGALLAAWAVLASNSLVLFLQISPWYIENLKSGPSRRLGVIAPRMIFYMASLLLVPYGLWFSWNAPEGHHLLRTRSIVILAATAVCSAALSLSDPQDRALTEIILPERRPGRYKVASCPRRERASSTSSAPGPATST